MCHYILTALPLSILESKPLNSSANTSEVESVLSSMKRLLTTGASSPKRGGAGSKNSRKEDSNVGILESVLKLEKMAKDIFNSRLRDLVDKTTEALDKLKNEGILTDSIIGSLKGEKQI